MKLYLNKDIQTTKLETVVKLMDFFGLNKIDEIIEYE